VHDVNLAARFADQVVLLNEARVVANGTPDEVLTSERIHAVFGVKPTFLYSGDAGVHFVFNLSVKPIQVLGRLDEVSDQSRVATRKSRDEIHMKSEPSRICLAL
jgi:hypothetical protein